MRLLMIEIHPSDSVIATKYYIKVQEHQFFLE